MSRLAGLQGLLKPEMGMRRRMQERSSRYPERPYFADKKTGWIKIKNPD